MFLCHAVKVPLNTNQPTSQICVRCGAAAAAVSDEVGEYKTIIRVSVISSYLNISHSARCLHYITDGLRHPGALTAPA